MFKGTNKIWKGLALLLVLCMLPTVALAVDDGATLKFVGEPAIVEGTPDAVTVTAEIGVKDTDITILAFRSATPATAVLTDVEDLKKQVVYIDQETAVEAGSEEGSGKHTFTFIPKTDAVGGKIINIFIGGENVTEPIYKSLEVASPAPTVTLTKLYKGKDLVLELAKPTGNDAYDISKWAEDIAKVKDDTDANVAVKVNGKAVAYTVADNKLTVTNAELAAKELANVQITSIDITGYDYANVKLEPTAEEGKWNDKEHGSFESLTTSVLSGVKATATLVESAQGGWAAALAASNAHTINDGSFTGLAIVDGAVELTLPTAPGVYSIVLKAADYVDYEVADITVLSPTEFAKEAIADKVATLEAANKETKEYYEAIEGKPAQDGLEDQMYGKRFVDLSDIELPTAAGASIEWTWADDCAEEGIEATETAGVYELKRSANADVTYTLTGTITKDSFTSTVTKTFTVGQLGIAGVDITIDPTAKLLHADAAKLATVTLKKGDVEIATVGYDDGFKFTAVTADTYTVIIARPGYVTASVEVAVTQDGLPNDFVVPAMIAGDIANNDGIIHADDYMAVVNAWRNEASKMGDAFPHNCDVNGDGYVHADDYMAVVNNWRHGM